MKLNSNLLSNFTEAELGDQVWSSKDGWGEVVEIFEIIDHPFPLRVNFKERGDCYYKLDGRDSDDAICATLFWNEIIAPSSPTKTSEYYVPVRYTPEGKIYIDDFLYENSESASICCSSENLVQIAVVEVETNLVRRVKRKTERNNVQ